MTVSPLDILAASAYRRGDNRTLADALKAGQAREIDAANANTENRQRDIANDNSQLGLEENQALHPLVMAQLAREAQGGQSQPAQAPNLPPPYQGMGPQPAPDKPFMLGQGAPSAAGSSMTGQPSAAPDPYAAQQSLLGEQKGLADYAQGHPAALALSPKLKAIEDAREKNLSERQGIAGTEFGLNQNRAFASLMPEMEQFKNQGVAAMQGAGTRQSIDAYNAMVKNIQSVVASKRPDLLASKTYQDYMRDVEKFKPTPQPNMAVMMGAPIPASAMESAAKRIANRESTVSEEMAKGFNRRPDAFQLHDQLVNQVKALDPTFTEQDTESGAAFAKNAATRRYVAAIDNARSTAARIAELTAKNAGTPSPALNQLINKFKVQAGDLDAAKTAIGQIAGTEEYSGAFTRSGGGSETTRGWADELGKLIYQNPAQAKASSAELLRAFDRNRQALMKQGGGYIKAPNYQFLPDEGSPKSVAPAAGAKGPLSKGEAHWYLDQAGNDMNKAMEMAKRDGRTF